MKLERNENILFINQYRKKRQWQLGLQSRYTETKVRVRLIQILD